MRQEATIISAIAAALLVTAAVFAVFSGQVRDTSPSATQLSFVDFAEPSALPTETQLSAVQGKANQLDDLLPPKGMWRGFTLQSNNVTDFETQMNVKLQIYRTFKGCSSKYAAALKQEEIDFVANGGILFYSTQPHPWGAFASGEKDDIIVAYAQQVKSLAPAKVFVAPGYEPDGHCEESGNTKNIYGTAAEYVQMYAHYQEIFRQQGVTNAVYLMDYSSAIRTTFDDLAVALWPGDDKVQWLMWNMFQQSNTENWQSGGGCSEMLAHNYELFSSAQTDTMFNVPWGLGAWGTMWDTFGGKALKESVRLDCLNGVATDLASGKYPNFKASIYYNSLNSIIQTVPVNYGGDNIATTTPSMVDAFSQMLNIEPFKINDPLFSFYKCSGDDC